jgi:hypothetical protein
MARPVHLRAVHAAGHRIVNRSHYRTDDLVALIEALDPFLRAMSPTPEATPRRSRWPLTFVSKRTPAAAPLADADEEYPWIFHAWTRTRGERLIQLASPHGRAAESVPAVPDGLPEPFVRWLCYNIADVLYGHEAWKALRNSFPSGIAALPVRPRRGHAAVVRSRVRNGILFARARALEESVHTRLVALQDAVLQARRLLIRLEAHLPAPALQHALGAFNSATISMELDLQQTRGALRTPERPTRGLTRLFDPEDPPYGERKPTPVAPLRVAPGPHVSALGSLEIENHTVYRTADLLAIVNRVEASAANLQGADGAPRIARGLQVTTPLGHLPRLSFVHGLRSDAPETGTEVAPLVAGFWDGAGPVTTVALRRPEERTGDPLRILSGALPRPRPADLIEVARWVGRAFLTRPPSVRGLRLRVARYAPHSPWPSGPTATRRALRLCGELRAAVRVIHDAVEAAGRAEDEVAVMVDLLHTQARGWRRMPELNAPLRALDTALDAIENKLGSVPHPVTASRHSRAS